MDKPKIKRKYKKSKKAQKVIGLPCPWDEALTDYKIFYDVDANIYDMYHSEGWHDDYTAYIDSDYGMWISKEFIDHYDRVVDYYDDVDSIDDGWTYPEDKKIYEFVENVMLTPLQESLCKSICNLMTN